MASGIELAKAYVQIIPTAEGISNSMTNLIEPEASKAGDESGELLGSKLVGKVKAALTGLGIAAAVKSVVNSVNEVATAGDNIDKMSQKMGIAADQFQALAFMGEHCAISTGTFQTAVKKLQTQGYNGTLIDFLDNLQGVSDVSQRTALAQEVLGEKVANEMAAFINGSDTMSDYYNQLKDLGGMMSQDAVTAAATYEDSLTNMNIAMNSMKNTIISECLPSFTQMMDGVTALFGGDSQGFQMIYNGMASLATGLLERGKEAIQGLINGILLQLPQLTTANGDMINGLLDNFLSRLPEFMARGGDLIVSIIKGIVTNIPSVIASIITLIGKILATILKHMPQIIQSGFNLLTKLGVGIINAIPQLISQLPKVFNAIKNAFKNINWAQVGRDIINGIINGIRNMAGSLGSSLSSVAKGALGTFKSFLGIHSPSTLFRDQIGKYIPEGIAIGIEQNENSVSDALENVTDTSIAKTKLLDSNISPISTNSSESGLATVIQLLQIIANKDFTSILEINGYKFATALAPDMDRALANEYKRGLR